MQFRILRNTSDALSDGPLQANLKHALGRSLTARAAAVSEVENWEELRSHARRIKKCTLRDLGRYLRQMEEQVQRQGGRVLWASDAREAVGHVLEIARTHQASTAAKSKSMLTEEIQLNAALEDSGIRPVETDLGEFILQLAGQIPSHIVAPALHMSRAQVAALFADKLQMEATDDVRELTETARRRLRSEFLKADLGISGVNFGIAETGTVVVVENEGNARLSTALPRVHIALMGIEKLIPRWMDLPVFLKLLTISATGQRITSYVNLLNGPKRREELDGPEHFYLIFVDNGRSAILKDDRKRQTLSCIRCGACQNVCPVFQSIGGHAYESTYQGPIGAILTPQLTTASDAPEHPFASSLCAACREICPVKIDIPEVLLILREQAVESRAGPRSERLAFRLWALAMTRPRIYRLGEKLIRLAFRLGAGGMKRGPLAGWARSRDLPAPATESFRSWMANTRGGRNGS